MTDDIRKRHGLPDESELTTADLAAANQPKPRAASELVTETETESESQDYPVRAGRKGQEQGSCRCRRYRDGARNRPAFFR